MNTANYSSGKNPDEMFVDLQIGTLQKGKGKKRGAFIFTPHSRPFPPNILFLGKKKERKGISLSRQKVRKVFLSRPPAKESPPYALKKITKHLNDVSIKKESD